MTILMVSCSIKAYELMKTLEEKLKQSDRKTDIVCKTKCRRIPEIYEKKSLTQCVGEWFERVDAIIFICAAGIAVRSIAPYIKHKSVDPAVIVLDESGKFCISLLSGHAGGANELAGRISKLIGAVPVITTATDMENKFAVDEFARKNNLVITDWKLAKEFSAGILAGENMGIISEMPVLGKIPEELHFYEGRSHNEKIGVFISNKFNFNPPFDRTLQLVPKNIAAGIGCRKGVSAAQITEAVRSCLMEENIRTEALCMAASIDLKKNEEGLNAFCEDMGIPFNTYSPEELRGVEGEFSSSEFVEKVTGVSNVCERSAAAASEGKLICGKKVYNGVTVALACMKGSVEF